MNDIRTKISQWIGREYIDGTSRRLLQTAMEEIERLNSLLARIPQTPEDAISFIGSNFNSMQAQGWTDTLPSEPTGDLSMVTYSLSVHDLLSAFSWAGLSGEDIDAALGKP
jgi:hypothetical protein